MSDTPHVDLTKTFFIDYDHGRSLPIRAAWVIIEALVLLNPVITSYRLKRGLLRSFGAKIGTGVIIKPGVHVKHPWRLEVGDNSWIGERAWIDNLAPVRVAANVCISQGAYLCTGNHDWQQIGMPLFAEPIQVDEGAWIAARAVIGPGVTVARNTVASIGSVITEDTEPDTVYSGNPAVPVALRSLSAGPSRRERSSASL